MTSRLRFLLTVLLFVGVAAMLYRSAGSVWRPLYAEVKGERTVKSVVAGLVAKGKGLSPEEAEITKSVTLIGLKKERLLEVWITDEEGQHQKIRGYPFTAFSGKSGPKLREGDLQIPEGVYEVEYLNPRSSYHLSVKLNYPNAFDRAKGREDDREFLGGDIFIHGRAVTIGCIPIGDEAIEDLFTIIAQTGPSEVKVILAPGDFRISNEFPEISAVEWEKELYSIVSEEIARFVP
ncbi:MAG: L,D-transpeptidase family protein [Verrucomicrobiales bacterium]|nr:L,D-transpeptidase family protein [Verrucomicrobiales bacterium]